MDETKKGKVASSWEGIDQEKDMAWDEKIVGPTEKTKMTTKRVVAVGAVPLRR